MYNVNIGKVAYCIFYARTKKNIEPQFIFDEIGVHIKLGERNWYLYPDEFLKLLTRLDMIGKTGHFL